MFLPLVEKTETEEAESEYDACPDYPLIAGVLGYGYLVDYGDADERAEYGADVHEIPCRRFELANGDRSDTLGARFNLPDIVKGAASPILSHVWYAEKGEGDHRESRH